MLELDSPEIFRSVLENLETGVLFVDPTRRIQFWNRGAETITGYLRQDVVGRLLRDHLFAASSFSSKVDPNLTDPLNLVFRDGKSSTTDVSILHKNGYRVPIVLRTALIRNSHGTVIGAAESFNKIRSASEQTHQRAVKDGLACLDEELGVLNRAYLETRLIEGLAIFAERQAPFAILIVQIDQMDQFLKTRGPGVVPVILRVVAQAVENCLRPADLVGRWSKVQFMAVLKECNETEVVRVGQRIRKIISDSEIEWWGDTFPVMAALGGAGVRTGDNLELLVERAERSLQESVATGGNCVTVLK